MKERGLKIKFVPHEKVNKDSLKKLLHDLEKNMIVVIDAKLTVKDEIDLIEETMKSVSDKFSGIEMSSMDIKERKKHATAYDKIYDKLKALVLEKVIGKKRGLTIIGPAKIIKRIEKNPEELLLHIK